MWHEKIFRTACALTVFFPVLLLGAAPADIGLCLIAVLFVIHSYMQKDWDWLKESWLRALGILWLYMIMRGMFTPHPHDALARSLPFVRYIVFAAALARWTLAHAPTRRRFLQILSTLVIACALDGLLQYATGHDILLHPIVHDPNPGHIRLDGPFTKPILGIMLAWLAFPALLPLASANISSRRNALATVFCAAAVVTVIALSGERVALLLTLLGCVIAAFLLRPSKRMLLAGGAGLAVLLVVLACVSPALFERQIASTAETLTHWQQSPYGLLLKSDLALAAEQPLTGLGANQFRPRCEALYAGDAERIATMCNTHPHNIYLEWLIEEGIIGFVLFVAFIAFVFKGCAQVFARERGNPVFAGLLIAFILRAWPFISTTGFFSRWGAPPFWLVLGALLVYTAGKGDKNAGASFTV